MTNLNNLVDQIYLINLEKRADRYALADKELQKIASQWTIMRPIHNDDPKVSFNQTCLSIMQEAKEMEFKSIAVFEDDVVIKPNDIVLDTRKDGHPHFITITPMDMLFHSANSLPPDWDILFLGANLRDGEPIKINDSLFKVTKAWTTHAVIYNKKCIEFIADNYAAKSMFDAWLSDCIENGYLNAYICAPMIAWQRPSFSDIWQNQADYTNAFVESEKKLR